MDMDLRRTSKRGTVYGCTGGNASKVNYLASIAKLYGNNGAGLAACSAAVSDADAANGRSFGFRSRAFSQR
ncbi:MAG: hypothetical protein JXC85_03595 [Candidatus Aenigmarchaeota archaeon]|nr:hypothetical protein [Candidatus Aenigmarchaeota archaeon]